MIKKLLIVNILYIVIGLVFYYFRHSIPIETTSSTIRTLYFLSLLLSIFSLGYLYFLISGSHKKTIKYLVSVIIIGLVIHNFLWTFLLLTFNNQYEDTKISYPDSNNKNHKIIEQYLDEGAIGSHLRTIEVYDFFPGFRYVTNIK